MYADRSFTFITKTPPASVLLKRAAGRREGLGRAAQERRSGTVTRAAGREIAQLKMPDLTAAEPRGGDAHRRGHGAQHRARGRVGHDDGEARASDIEGGGARRSIREKRYPLDEAVQLAGRAGGAAKFDETVELAVRLGVDPRQADQNVRGTVVLPHGTGKTVRVLVFAKGEKVQGGARRPAPTSSAARSSPRRSRTRSGSTSTPPIATPDMMGAVGRLGKILGPRGLMPNPKVGTVTFDVGKAVREVKAGKVEFRVEKAGIVHVPIGKRRFGPEKLLENAHALVGEPASAPSRRPRRATTSCSMSVATTMGPGVHDRPDRRARAAAA